MLKVECESCKAPYQVDERRVPPTGLKMRCPKCGHTFLVTDPSKGSAPRVNAAPALPKQTAPKKATMVGLMPDARKGAPPPPAMPDLELDVALPAIKPAAPAPLPKAPNRPSPAAPAIPS